jgi:hemophore
VKLVTSSKSSPSALRRGLFAAFAVTAAGGATVAALTVPATPAAAAPDPCAASEVAKTIGSVANNTGAYLDSHPETNAALTTASQSQGGPAALGSVKNYFDANPQAAKDMQTLQQPLTNLSGRCKLPLTVPQVLGLMQTAQQQGAGALPGGLPGSLPSAQSIGVPVGQAPPGTVPVSSASQGGGPLPGPSVTGVR